MKYKLLKILVHLFLVILCSGPFFFVGYLCIPDAKQYCGVIAIAIGVSMADYIDEQMKKL